MATLDKATGYFQYPLEQVKDPIRTSHWRLRFNVPLIKAQVGDTFLSDVNSDDDISVMIKTAKMPKLDINTAEAWYMGQSVQFATNSTYEKESSFEVLETEDVRGYRFLGLWHQLAHNTDLIQNGSYGTHAISPTETRGINLGSAKYTSTADSGKSVVRNTNWMYLELYDYTTGEVVVRVNYINAFPSSLGDFSLSYEGSDLVKYTVVFKHDFHRIVIGKDGTGSIT